MDYIEKHEDEILEEVKEYYKQEDVKKGIDETSLKLVKFKKYYAWR